MKNRKPFSIIICLLIVILSAAPCFAATPTDEVLNYYVLADVNDDGTVSLFYHIEWKVLDDQKYGPVDWLKIGVANQNCDNIQAITDNITDIYYTYDYGDFVYVYFDRSYYKNEVVEFEFMLDQDNLYSVNYEEDGYTTFYFLPGWFDDTPIDRQAIYWNAEKVHKWDMGATNIDGYLVWEFQPEIGQTEGVMLSYPNDAYGFDTTKYGSWDKNHNGYEPYGPDQPYPEHHQSIFETIFRIIGFFLALALGFAPVIVPFLIIRSVIRTFKGSSGFASGETKTKVTRTKIEYYPNCPGCGAQRKEGETTCEYCGRSFIKSEEILKEEEIKDEDKEALKYKKKGEYAYSSIPNTYVRVNVVHVPVSSGSSRSGRTGSASSGRSSSSSHSSCAHSSCACACASCACACACACAGGGRAGCSTKDFYNTKLKLKQLKMKRKKHR